MRTISAVIAALALSTISAIDVVVESRRSLRAADDASLRAAESARVAAPAAFTKAVFIMIPRMTGCSWIGNASALKLGDSGRPSIIEKAEGEWSKIDIATQVMEWRARPRALAEVCGRPAGKSRVGAMLAQWTAELNFGWESVSEAVRQDNGIVKVFAWPEWTARAIDGEVPLSLAEKRALEAGMAAAVRALGDVSIFVIAGTIYWGVQLAPPADFLPMLNLDDGFDNEGFMPQSYCGSSMYKSDSTSKWAKEDYTQNNADFVKNPVLLHGAYAVFNCLPRFGNLGKRMGSHCKYFESENKRTAHPFKEIWGHCLWKMAGEAALGADVMAELGSRPFLSSANVIEGRAVGADICADHRSRATNSAEQAGRVLLDASYRPDAALDLLVITANSMSPFLCSESKFGDCSEPGTVPDNIRLREGGFLANVNGMPGVWTGNEIDGGAALFKVKSVRVSEGGTPYATKLENLPLTPHWPAGATESGALANEVPWCVTSAVVNLPPKQAVA
jgi:hypothetical protein